MQTYKLIIRTETVDAAGKTVKAREEIPHLLEGDVENHWQAARRLAPRGSTCLRSVVREI